MDFSDIVEKYKDGLEIVGVRKLYDPGAIRETSQLRVRIPRDMIYYYNERRGYGALNIPLTKKIWDDLKISERLGIMKNKISKTEITPETIRRMEIESKVENDLVSAIHYLELFVNEIPRFIED